ncbi:hypothetical protein KAH37_07290 [bacterium]|nr:hypothetical protein [bacterium]
MRPLIFIFLFALLASCGGQESFSIPMVKAGDIVQTSCKEVTASLPKEDMHLELKDRTLTYTHTNMVLPKGSVIGIEDRDRAISWSAGLPYYYLEADEGFMNLHERIRYATNEEMCLYDVTIKITEISGGEYNFFVYNNDNILTMKVFLDVY